MNFGDTLRCLIEDNDMTQKQVATKLNIAPTTLGNYVRNLREPDFETLVKLADYFNVSTDFLLNRTYKDSISQEENRLLSIYAKLSESEKKRFIEIGKILGN